MSRSIFITATDTDAGKTWVTAHMLRQLLSQGVDAQALKPLASGLAASGLNEDVQLLLEVQGQTDVSRVNFHTYASPVAPALAAAREGTALNIQHLSNWIKEQETKADITLIEGVGGLMVPLVSNPNQTWLVSDWLQSLQCVDVMLVVPLRLGCMNHLLLSCKLLAEIGCAPKWIVLNDLDHNQTGEETKQMVLPFVSHYFNLLPDILCVNSPDDLDIKL